eukprot:364590-Chlamydomonas_euryale.AAC.1
MVPLGSTACAQCGHGREDDAALLGTGRPWALPAASLPRGKPAVAAGDGGSSIGGCERASAGGAGAGVSGAGGEPAAEASSRLTRAVAPIGSVALAVDELMLAHRAGLPPYPERYAAVHPGPDGVGAGAWLGLDVCHCHNYPSPAFFRHRMRRVAAWDSSWTILRSCPGSTTPCPSTCPHPAYPHVHTLLIHTSTPCLPAAPTALSAFTPSWPGWARRASLRAVCASRRAPRPTTSFASCTTA